jgi:hypothetical protein
LEEQITIVAGEQKSQQNKTGEAGAGWQKRETDA